MKEQCNDLPVSVFHSFNECKEHLAKLEPTVTSYLDKTIEIEPFFYQLSMSGTMGLDTKIIKNSGDKQLLKKWVRKQTGMNNLKLLYRGSEHGFTAQNFHSKCDNIEHTLTVVKST
mmetsp:Transcript_25258/g.22267  ORF Transcript_25258/g.22267 Transcript_25258/m.22267 type:complete len:116 (+) Transcript_25258:731-1078(+)